MRTEPTPAEQSQHRARGAAAGLVLLAAIAGWLSYASVRALAVSKIGPIEGSAFPLLLDMGVYVSSRYYLAGASRGRAQRGYQTLTRALIAATITINAAAAHDWRAVLVHIVPPAVFAALVELRATQVLRDRQAADGIERIPLKLWLVSPVKAWRISLYVARKGAHGDLWTQRERRAAAVRALGIAVPGRGQARQARRQARAALRTGMLDPGDLIAATGLDIAAEETGPAAVLRVALRASLGASGNQGVNASGAASRVRPSASEGAPGMRTRSASGAGQAASGPIVLPPARRIRSASESATESPSEAALKASALDIDRATIAETGAPAGLRQLQRELGIGQARATELRDWLAAQRAQLAAVEHANGHQA